MKVVRKSIISGITRTRDLDVTEEQMKSWMNGELAQNAFRNLSPSDREFIMTGITDDEWEETLGDDSES